MKRVLWMLLLLALCLCSISLAEENTVGAEKTLEAGKTVELDDEWSLTLQEVSQKAGEVKMTLEISREADDGLTTIQIWQQVEAWGFQLLSEADSNLAFSASSCHPIDEKGNIEYWLCYRLTEPMDSLYLYPTQRHTENDPQWLLDQGSHGRIITSISLLSDAEREQLFLIALPENNQE